MIDYLLYLSNQPAWIFLAIILSSYLLEDLAIIGAAILAADQVISMPLAASAIIIGIVSGDIGLYLIGYIANKFPGLKQKLLSKGRDQQFSNLLNNNLFKNILLIRFVPGLRFICYTSCGLLRIHPGSFIFGVSLATVLWVGVVFGVIYQLGSNAWLEHSEWKWALVPIALFMLYLFNRRYMHSLKQV